MKVFKFIFLAFLLQVILLSCSEENKSQDKKKEEVDHISSTLDTARLLSEDGKWRSLFNGENLDGWEVKMVKEDQAFEFWKVENGVIVVNSLGQPEHNYVWLQTNTEYADFVLKLKYQSYRDSPGNSGVQIRSRYDLEARIEGESWTGWLDGPQVDIHPSGPWRTGYIYDETRGHRRWIYPDLPDWRMDKETYEPKIVRHFFSDEAPYWNDLVIICKGSYISTYVNGNMVADFDGTGVLDDESHQKYGIDKKGFIALQLHQNDELKMAYKDLMIKEI